MRYRTYFIDGSRAHETAVRQCRLIPDPVKNNVLPKVNLRRAASQMILSNTSLCRKGEWRQHLGVVSSIEYGIFIYEEHTRRLLLRIDID